MTIPTDAGGNAIDYDSEIGWCPDCGDVELKVFVAWSFIFNRCLRYTCPACGWTRDVIDAKPDSNESSILPPYVG